MTEEGERFIEGVWAIFGNGNVAGVGEALRGIGDALPTWRGQNEQTMAHAAIAYAKTRCRRRAHAVTAPAKDANKLPSDAQVIGAVQRAATENPVAMCAAGTMPGALQVLGGRKERLPHGIRLFLHGLRAGRRDRDRTRRAEKEVLHCDGSYMMANSELATAVMRRVPFTVVLTDNRG